MPRRRRAARSAAPRRSRRSARPFRRPATTHAGVGDASPIATSTGIRNGVLCGTLQRPLDPARRGRADRAPLRRRAGDGTPQVRRSGVPPRRRPGAERGGGRGGDDGRSFSRLNNRRDIVFVDQRGTGGSAPLQCPDPEHETLTEQADPERQVRLAVQCKAELLKLPYLRSEGDLRFFTTSIAVQDLDAVRRALGAEQIDLVGASYGTRVALEYQRQFPQAVRRSVLDGAAPPDMVLPASFSLDNQAALDALARRLRRRGRVRARPSRSARASRSAARLAAANESRRAHPLTGRSEEFILSRDMLLGALAQRALRAAARRGAAGGDRRRQGAASSPAWSGSNATFTSAQVDAARDRHAPLGRLHRGRAARARERRPAGRGVRHRLRPLLRAAVRGLAARRGAGGVLHDAATSAVPILVLSGGIDPATPPRHGERVVRALRAMARHVVVANAGHGVLGDRLHARRGVPLHRRGDRQRRARRRRRLRRERAAAAGVSSARRGGGAVGALRERRGDRGASSRQVVRGAGARGGAAGSATAGATPRAGSATGERRIHAVRRRFASTRRTAAITGLLGPNGAGKTTTLRMLAALDRARRRIDAGRRHRRRRAHPRDGARAHGRALGRARPLSAPDRAREHRLLRRAARHGRATPPTRAPRSSPACSR